MSTNITLVQAIKKKYIVESTALIKYLKAANNDKLPEWNDLSKLFLTDFVNILTNNLSQNTSRTYCAYLKSVLNLYNDEILIPCRNYGKILSLRKIASWNVYNTDEEIKTLIDYKPQNDREHTIRNQYVLSCLTGMRHSDVIRIDSNNLNDDSLFYQSQKTLSSINTYLCGVTEFYLKQGLNKVYSDVTYNTTIREICQKVGINQPTKIIRAGKEISGFKYQFMSSHTGRRSFATNLYKAIKDLYFVSKLMGHKDVRTSQS